MLFNEETISNEIHTKWAGKTVHFAKETDSTNIWAKSLAKEGAPHGTLAVAEFQSAGRGRFDRRWTAPEGSAVTMSILLRPEFSPQYASMLTLVMGLSVAQAVRECGFSASIKWPNDAVVSGRKICGILTEMGVLGSKIQHVIIGVGINVNTPEFQPEIADKATSLFLESNKIWDRNRIAGLVMKYFEANYEKFSKTCDLTYLKEEYEELLANKMKPVRVLDGKNSYEGLCRGINDRGELLVERQDGQISCVGAGEVSVRGLYSYV